MRDSQHPSDLPDWDLLDRYYAGEATDLEQERLEAYLMSHPARRPVLEALANVVRREAVPTIATNVRTMLSAAHQRIAQSLGTHPSARRPEYGSG